MLHTNDMHTAAAAGLALEIALVDHRHLGIEARQAQRRAYGVDERGGPADLAPQRTVFAQAGQRPVVHHQGRREAEADEVGQRVVLDAEFALGIGQARHPAVHAIQQGRHEHGDRRLGKTAANADDDGVETGEHGAGGKQVRQQVNTGMPRRPDWRGVAHGSIRDGMRAV
jgi:hypothetical protein